MQRKSFIEKLVALGAFGFLPAKALTHYQKFYLLQCFVAGFKYYKGMELLHQMKQGDQLELVREPVNEFDSCAIALHWNQQKIGFVPAADNEVLSRLLDAAALELTAEITHLNKEVQPWENLSVAVYFLKQTTVGPVPENMQYLTTLTAPYYTSYKSGSHTITRVVTGEIGYESNPDWAGFLEENSANDSIYDIIMTSDVLPTYAYGSETGDYLLVNKKRLPDKHAVKQVVNKAEEVLGELNNLFDEEGYIVLSTGEAAGLVPQLEKIVNVTDKLGRHFIELQF